MEIIIPIGPSKKTVLRLIGDRIHIARRPDLAKFSLPALNHDLVPYSNPLRNQPCDHTFLRAIDGTWRLWACVRNSEVGRLLVEWSSSQLTSPDWALTGNYIRSDRKAGESIVDWHGQEFLQSPLVVRDANGWAMLYGGYDTGVDIHGQPTTDYGAQEKQLCLMRSKDGITWSRHRDAQGHSRVFVGPGAVRDPWVGRVGDRWLCLYSGHLDGITKRAAILARWSDDLVHWTDWTVAHRDPEGAWQPESPWLEQRNGRFILFRTQGPEDGTYILVSDKADSFPVKPVGHLRDIVAPEFVTDVDGKSYMSTIEGPDGYGVWLQRIEWCD